MMGLTKVNDDWVPLQTKVFSRWVSTQLKSFPDIEVNDIQKDLSNGVALVELATILTHKKPTRGWYDHPKMKIEMVQNCELALEMFSKDGVNFVGISGKDISDNNTKLILGLVWTLIMRYSICHSIKNSDNDDKINETKSDKSSLLHWANERTEHYPNVHNFAPFDLSLCALLDSYFPNKINYYSLNPDDSQNNAKLATKVMEKVGIPVLVYPDELQKTNNVVDEKTLLTQLSSAKIVLDENESKTESTSDKIDLQNDFDEPVVVQKVDSSSYDESTEEDQDDEEVIQLKKTIAECQNEIEILKNAREVSENERNQANLELTKLQNQLEIERTTRERKEIELIQEKARNAENQLIIEELRSTIHDLENQCSSFEKENNSNIEEIKRLRCAWEMAQIEIETERDAREEAEFKLDNIKHSQIEKAEQQYRLSSLMKCIGEMQAQMNNKIELIEERVDRAQRNITQISKEKQMPVHNDISDSSENSEVERLRCAWDMGQIELENERKSAAEKQFELENINHEMNKETSTIEKEELKYRIPNFMNLIGQIQIQLNRKIESIEERIDAAHQKVNFFKQELVYLKNQNENLKLENDELKSRIEKEYKTHRATLLAYEDAILSAQKEAREQKEEREKADIAIDHLMKQLKEQNN